MNALFHMFFGRLLVRVFRRPANWIESFDKPLKPKRQPTFKPGDW